MQVLLLQILMDYLFNACRLKKLYVLLNFVILLKFSGENVNITIYLYNFLLQFAEVLNLEGLHKAFLDRAVTVFAPNNYAMQRFRGRRNENLVLNHMSNVAIFSDKVSTYLWVSIVNEFLLKAGS